MKIHGLLQKVTDLENKLVDCDFKINALEEKVEKLNQKLDDLAYEVSTLKNSTLRSTNGGDGLHFSKY